LTSEGMSDDVHILAKAIEHHTYNRYEDAVDCYLNAIQLNVPSPNSDIAWQGLSDCVRALQLWDVDLSQIKTDVEVMF
jgi:hypothetical protein